MKGEAVVYSLAGAGLTLFFFLSSHWLGPVGAFTNMLAAFPVCYLVMRFGLLAGIVSVLLATGALWQLAGGAALVSYGGLFVVPSLFLPSLLKRGLAWDRTLLISGVLTLLLAGSLLLVYVQISGQTLGTLLEQYLSAEVDTAMQAYREAGFSESQLATLGEVATRIVEFIRSTFVGLYAAGVLIVHLVTLLFLQWFKRAYYRIAGIAFVQWRLPALLIWLLIVAGFSLLAPWGMLALTGRNILAVLLPLYFVQGLAVLSCILQRKNWPPVTKGLIYLLVFVLNPLPLVVTGVGVFDLWVDFRRPRKKDL